MSVNAKLACVLLTACAFCMPPTLSIRFYIYETGVNVGLAAGHIVHIVFCLIPQISAPQFLAEICYWGVVLTCGPRLYRLGKRLPYLYRLRGLARLVHLKALYFVRYIHTRYDFLHTTVSSKYYMSKYPVVFLLTAVQGRAVPGIPFI